MAPSRFVLAALLVMTASGAQAQGSPSADQIINSLRPSGGMMGGTRGIRPVTPAQSVPEAAAPTRMAPASAGVPVPRTAVPVPRTAAARPGALPAVSTPAAPPSVNLTVQFATNSVELTPAAVRTLSELGRALSSSALGSYRFRIEGHTDTAGQPDANKALSERRAQAVVTFLASRFRIDASRLDAVGMGQDGLLVQTPPGTAEPQNRRVQVINLGA